MAEQDSKKKRRLLRRIVGVLAIVLAAAYFVFMFISYYNRHKVNFYEVEEGSLVKEHNYSGIILRNETTVKSEANGYLNFYVADTRKVKKESRIYSVDESGNLKAYLSAHSEELTSLNKAKIQAVRATIMNSQKLYSDIGFRDAYALKDTLDASVLEFTDIDALIALSDRLKDEGISFKEYRTDMTGIVSYSIDGFEDTELNDIALSMFDKTKYTRSRLKSGELVVEGEPVYKLITDENWSIVFPMSEEDISEFSGKEQLRISFKEKGITSPASFTTMRNLNGESFGVLSLKRYLIQFLSDRFIDFEIVTNDVSGLKIPDKSITVKNFYIIPSSFKKTDGKGNTGFLKEVLSDNGTSEKFVITDIYFDDGEYCYADIGENGPLRPDDYVLSPEEGSSDRYRIGSVRPLEGVYNINKGYTVFKRIEPLESANGYCIVKKNTSYGLAVYDHIILDAQTVTEGQVLY